MSKSEEIISVCPWLGDRRWVYSITFDESLSDLHRFVVPLLAEHTVPGHLEVVAGQIGEIRHVGTSSYNGMKHMSAEELREMVDLGWGIGNHSWSHGAVNTETVDQELGEAKVVLEEAAGQPITVYCAPGSNLNMNEGALEGCRRFGYVGAMSITDALNRPEDDDLLWLNRTFLHHQGYGPFFSEFDPYRNIQHAQRDSGWIIDYLHCPLETPIHPNKDCSADQLRERIETIIGEGGKDVWLATVEEPLDYRYTRRHVRLKTDGQSRYQISAEGLPHGVTRRTVTISVHPNTRTLMVDGQQQEMYRRNGKLLADLDLGYSRQLTIL